MKPKIHAWFREESTFKVKEPKSLIVSLDTNGSESTYEKVCVQVHGEGTVQVLPQQQTIPWPPKPGSALEFFVTPSKQDISRVVVELYLDNVVGDTVEIPIKSGV